MESKIDLRQQALGIIEECNVDKLLAFYDDHKESHGWACPMDFYDWMYELF